MDANEFKTKLEALQDGKDLYEFHVGLVNKERETGIKEKSDANKEAQNLRKYKIALEKLGFNKDSDELDAYIETLKASSFKAKEADNTKLTLDSVNSELAALRDKFLSAQNELTSEKKRAAEIALEVKKKTLKSKLTDSLRDKVYGHDFVADALINDNKVDLENDTVFFKEGEAKVAFDDGIKKLLETRTDILKNGQKGGANSSPQSNTETKKYSIDQINGMSKEDIKANLKDVKASLGIKT
jgi:hypothetical protein